MGTGNTGRMFGAGSAALLVAMGAAIGAVLRPVAAGGTVQAAAPVERSVSISLTPTDRLQTPKAHWGIYALAQYDYSPSGKKTVVRKNDLIVEEDMSIARGGNHTAVKLKSGEYEIHVEADNARPIVKRFLVNNLGTGFVPLVFTITPVEDPAERQKTEVVRLGPSLGDLEARITALEKKNGIAAAIPVSLTR